MRGARRRVPGARARGGWLTCEREAVVIGYGRVGSASAKALQAEGWDVCAIDEKEEALQRLGENWTGGFVVGHGMDPEALREAEMEGARP